MARQPDLGKIGAEGFAIVEAHFVKPRARAPPQNPAPLIHRNVAKGPQPITHFIYPPEESHVYHATRVSSSEATVMTGYEAALLHDGTAIMDFARRKQARMAF